MTAEQIGSSSSPVVPAVESTMESTVESTVVTALRVRRLLARLVLGDSCDAVARRAAA
ncbi:hypothetical protein [Nocardioides sp. 1609]|uniref:hypothetical protein n=1 Tax=Nocardioides sp. 1609 TaxID=2508327 RepID=UPI0014306650|nr:hypothetical protein [Nocardioides sp. 1609]